MLTRPPDVPIDPRYSDRIAYVAGNPLDQKSVLATATVTVAIVAMMNFYGQIGSFQNPPIPRFSSVSIQFKWTVLARQVDTRIVIWALYNVILKHSFKRQVSVSEAQDLLGPRSGRHSRYST